MASDPLYEMPPTHEDYWGTLAEEAESLASAIWSDNDERRDRKLQELTHALLVLARHRRMAEEQL